MNLRAVGRRFTQMNAYFLVMNSKRCTVALNSLQQPKFSVTASEELFEIGITFNFKTKET